jgi:hypothetical protein
VNAAPSFLDCRSLAIMIRVYRAIEQHPAATEQERASHRNDRETLEVMLSAKMNPPAPKRRRRPLEART